jgi:mono/diheme cytochrome c family protein
MAVASQLRYQNPQGGPIVHRFFISTFAVASALACVGTATAQDQGQIDRGMKIYVEQKCANCHSIAGKGNAKGPLDDVGKRLKADDIREWITDPVAMAQKAKAERKPAMKANPNVSTEDVDALVAYMVSLKKK